MIARRTKSNTVLALRLSRSQDAKGQRPFTVHLARCSKIPSGLEHGMVRGLAGDRYCIDTMRQTGNVQAAMQAHRGWGGWAQGSSGGGFPGGPSGPPTTTQSQWPQQWQQGRYRDQQAPAKAPPPQLPVPPPVTMPLSSQGYTQMANTAMSVARRAVQQARHAQAMEQQQEEEWDPWAVDTVEELVQTQQVQPQQQTQNAWSNWGGNQQQHQ